MKLNFCLTLLAGLLFQFSFMGGQSLSAQDESVLDQLKATMSYRSIGPFRGGRSAACTGVIGKPMEAYFGAAGGGVWKTEDGGSSWFNISDGFFGNSIGAVAVADSDPNTIYVGGGEVTVRGNVSHGDGVWKSIDGGKNWKHIGLADTQTIPRIRIHPTDPDLVYVAALGHLYGPNQQRGVFRSKDGGENWEQILFVSDEAGAVDLVIDPNNTRVLYASTWKVKRTPYSLESGGEGSGLWKSEDGGDTWTDITGNRGLPGGTIGIIGIAVSPVDSNRLWAQVEADKGGLFRSNNAGESWTRVNDERKLRQRAWYYTRVYAGPDNIDEVYVLNVGFWRSKDGGRTFGAMRTPHGDHHDLWINPDDANHLVIADDGGGQISYDRGENFSTYLNQPTAQFYRVTTDNHFPYRIYGAQQDNSTVRIKSRSDGFSIGERDWESTAGGESGHIAPHPENPDIVYGGSYGGYLTRRNHATGETRNVHIWPDNPMGHGAEDLKFRFQWNFPIHFSPHSPDRLYAAANVLFVTEDEGQSWKQISPDLTRNDRRKLVSSGGPITKDNTGVEYYCTIFAFAESTHEAGVLWCGSDDGLIHVSRDGGENWNNVTPAGMPEWAQVNSIEINPHEPGGLYAAATRYKSDDFKPYLFKTTDYGETWTEINNGIDRKHFTRVIRADPVRKGLLFAGTERGIYISMNDGKSWQDFSLDHPEVPITDLAIKENDLIVATQGRSFYVLDDLTPLHQWNESIVKADVHMFQPAPTMRLRGFGSGRASRTAGANPTGGVGLTFFLKEIPDGLVTLDIMDSNDQLAQRFSTKPDSDKKELRLELKEGINQLNWNMSYPGAETFEGMVLWGGGTGGPRAVPGNYRGVMTIQETGESGESDDSAEGTGEDSENSEVSYSVEFEILIDPRASATVEDLQEQFDFLIELRDKLSETHRSIARIREAKSQIATLKGRISGDEAYSELVQQSDKIIKALSEIEEALYQTKLQSSQDPLNFPIRLNNRLSGIVGVVSSGDNRPTKQAYEVREEISGLIDQQLTKLNSIISEDIQQFNQAVHDAQVPAIMLKSDDQ